MSGKRLSIAVASPPILLAIANSERAAGEELIASVGIIWAISLFTLIFIIKNCRTVPMFWKLNWGAPLFSNTIQFPIDIAVYFFSSACFELLTLYWLPWLNLSSIAVHFASAAAVGIISGLSYTVLGRNKRSENEVPPR